MLAAVVANTTPKTKYINSKTPQNRNVGKPEISRNQSIG